MFLDYIMSRKRPARIVNPDLRQQKHLPTPPIEEIEKEIFSLLSPASFKPMRLYDDEQKKKFRDRIADTLVSTVKRRSQSQL